MSNPEVVVNTKSYSRTLSASAQLRSVIVVIHAKSEQTTGNGRIIVHPSCIFQFTLSTACPQHISFLLRRRVITSYLSLCDEFASQISRDVKDIGFGQGFIYRIVIRLTYKITQPIEDHVVQLGVKRVEDSKRSSEGNCTICLNSLAGNGSDPSLSDYWSKPSLLPCSHVFHSDCILKWLIEENLCPLCRTSLLQPRR